MQLCGTSGDGSGTIVGVIDTPPGGVLLGQPMAGATGGPGPAGPPGPPGPMGPAGVSGGAVDVAAGVAAGAATTTVVDSDEFPVSSAGVLKKLSWANLKGLVAAWFGLRVSNITAGYHEMGFNNPYASSPGNYSLIVQQYQGVTDNGLLIQNRPGEVELNPWGGATATNIILNTRKGGDVLVRASAPGTLKVNNVAVVDVSSAQSLSNKTLFNPTVTTGTFTSPTLVNAFVSNGATSTFRHSSGDGFLMFAHAAASTGNFFRIDHSVTGAPPTLSVTGTDANVDLVLKAEGTGSPKAFTPDLKGRGGRYFPIGVKVAVPTSATAGGRDGEWAADSGFIYVCVAPNTWKTVPLTAYKDNFPVRMVPKPAVTVAPGEVGDIAIDPNYLYICYGSHSWGRVAMDTAW